MGAMKDAAYGDRPVYPDSPGYRGKIGGPSQRAAEAVAHKAKSFSASILAHLRTKPSGATADEIAAAMEVTERYSVRPRLAELRRRGDILDTGQSRIGVSGLRQTVWKVADPLPTRGHANG